MQWPQYKEICKRPDYWSRWMIEQSIEILQRVDRTDLKAPLMAALVTEPVPTPDGHKGGAGLNMLRLSCPVRFRQAIVDAIVAARDEGIKTSGTQDRGLGGFEEAWREYSTFPD